MHARPHLCSHCPVPIPADCPHFVRASIETASFTFEAFGLGHKEAEDALKRGVKKHIEKFSAGKFSKAEMTQYFRKVMKDIEFTTLTMGGCLRDKQEIK